jgi:hypothetical protein
MTTLCLTGGSPARLEAAAAVLHRAGMARPAPLAGEAGVDFAHWHQHACEALGQTEEATPGRLWERLAADLFLANADTPLWGWAETRSVALLEFWAGFEASIRFVLLCETPRQALRNILRQNTATEPVEAVLLQWQQTHEALLRFHLRQPRRSLLVWAEDAERTPHELLQTINNRWSLQLADETATPAATTPASMLEIYLADRIAEKYPQVETLARELQASIDMLADSPPADSTIIDGDALIEGYRGLCDRSSEEQLIAAAQGQIEQLTQARDAEAKGKAEAIAQKVALAKEKAEAIAQRDAEAKGKADAQARIGVLEKEKGELSAARDQQAKLAQERQGQIEQLTQARDAEAKGKADAQARIGVLEKEKGELSAARDQQAKLAQERQGQIEQLTQARDAEAKGKAEAIAQKVALAKEKAEAIAQRDAEAKGKADAQARIGVLEKEKGELSAARDQQAKLAQERQGQIEQLTQARDAEAKGKAETIAQKEALAKEKTDAIAERDESRQRLQDQQARMQQLETENTEARMRQTLLQDELVKAEAQIELIKDLLLREPGL